MFGLAPLTRATCPVIVNVTSVHASCRGRYPGGLASRHSPLRTPVTRWPAGRLRLGASLAAAHPACHSLAWGCSPKAQASGEHVTTIHPAAYRPLQVTCTRSGADTRREAV